MRTRPTAACCSCRRTYQRQSETYISKVTCAEPASSTPVLNCVFCVPNTQFDACCAGVEVWIRDPELKKDILEDMKSMAKEAKLQGFEQVRRR